MSTHPWDPHQPEGECKTLSRLNCTGLRPGQVEQQTGTQCKGFLATHQEKMARGGIQRLARRKASFFAKGGITHARRGATYSRGRAKGDAHHMHPRVMCVGESRTMRPHPGWPGQPPMVSGCPRGPRLAHPGSCGCPLGPRLAQQPKQAEKAGRGEGRAQTQGNPQGAPMPL